MQKPALPIAELYAKIDAALAVAYGFEDQELAQETIDLLLGLRTSLQDDEPIKRMVSFHLMRDVNGIIIRAEAMLDQECERGFLSDGVFDKRDVELRKLWNEHLLPLRQHITDYCNDISGYFERRRLAELTVGTEPGPAYVKQ